MMRQISSLFFSQWKFILGYLSAYSFLKILEANILDFSILFLFAGVFLLISFSISSYEIVGKGYAQKFFRSFYVKDKKVFLELIVLLVAIFVIYYLLSMPFILIGFIDEGEFGKIAQNKEITTLVSGLIDVVFKSIFHLILASSIACLVKYRVGSFAAIKLGFRIIVKAPLLILTIFMLNVLIECFSFIDIKLLGLRIDDFLWGLILPAAVVWLYGYLQMEIGLTKISPSREEHP